MKRIIRELELRWKELNQDQYPYQKVEFIVLSDGWVIAQGTCNIRAMYLHFEAIKEAVDLPVQ